MPRAKASDIDLEIAARLKAIMIAKGVTVTALADGIGCTAQQAAKYRSGINRMSGGVMTKIMEFLDIPSSALFSDPVGFPMSMARARKMARVMAALDDMPPALADSIADHIYRLRHVSGAREKAAA